MAAPLGVCGVAGAMSVALLLAACGSSSSSSSSSTAPTPSASVSATPTALAPTASPHTTASGAQLNSCSVVTQAEAASAIGQKVTPGVLGDATVEGGVACVFFGPAAPAAEDANIGQPDTVRVVLVTGRHAQKWYDAYKSKVPFRPVAGFGGKAYFDGGASLSILIGDSYLRIAVSPAGRAPSLPDEKKLATAILPNL